MNGIQSVEDLRALIRDIADGAPEPEPSVVTDKVLGQLSAVERRVALAACLPGYVSDLLRRDAALARHRPPVTVEQGGQRFASRRVAAVRADVLRTRFYTGVAWKWLGECTADDLDGAAGQRDEAAAALRAEADRWRALAAFMRGQRLATVAAVPSVDLERFLDGAAA